MAVLIQRADIERQRASAASTDAQKSAMYAAKARRDEFQKLFREQVQAVEAEYLAAFQRLL
jgi:hypothetical protein